MTRETDNATLQGAQATITGDHHLDWAIRRLCLLVAEIAERKLQLERVGAAESECARDEMNGLNWNGE